jgi:tetratricopeptide (TPR) repeat protein
MSLKNIIFSITVVASFFAGCELLLALAGVRPALSTEDPFFGFARNIPLFVEHKAANGSTVLRTAANKRMLFNPQEFPRVKGRNTYRIFCMGGSTTFGRPYTDRVSFCGWLRAYLEAADPSRDWQIVNAGGVSYASYRVARLMNELAHYQPDLFIVYSGQNEFLEQRSYGRLADLPDWLIDLNATLSGTRIYTAMSEAIDALKPGSSRLARHRQVLKGEVDEILNHTIGPQSYHRNDTLRRRIMKHYRLNLERMVRIARKAGAGIIFIEPAVNLKDMSPFKSEHRAGLDKQALERWQALYDHGAKLEADGDHDAALAVYRQALAIDDRYAELHYRIGQVLFRLGKYAAAGQAFRRAVDEDIAPLRILSPMQRSVAEIAGSEAVPLVDFPGLLRKEYLKRYGHAVFGKEFFVDHVHPTMEGYRLLGVALLDKLTALGIASPDASWNQARLDAVTRQVLASLNPADEGNTLIRLGKVMEWSGKFAEAYPLFQRGMEILGPSPENYDRLARTAYVLGRLDDAAHYLERSELLVPMSSEVHARLSEVLAQQGKTAQAIGQCESALLLKPDDYHVRARFAGLLERQGDDAAALDQYRKVLRARPDFARAHLGLARLLLRLNHLAEALEHAREALRIDPGLYQSHDVIGLVMMRQGKPGEAARQFSEALRQAPGDTVARNHLQQLQASRNRKDHKQAAATGSS